MPVSLVGRGTLVVLFLALQLGGVVACSGADMSGPMLHSFVAFGSAHAPRESDEPARGDVAPCNANDVTGPREQGTAKCVMSGIPSSMAMAGVVVPVGFGPAVALPGVEAAFTGAAPESNILRGIPVLPPLPPPRAA